MDKSSARTQLSIRVPNAIIEAFDQIATALDRDRTWVMVRALRQYLDAEGADLLEETAGVAALDRGEGEDFDAVMAAADGIIAEAKATGTKTRRLKNAG